MTRGEARLARQQRGFLIGRSQPPATPPPGMVARVAAARAIMEAVVQARPLEDRFAADLSLRDARPRSARSERSRARSPPSPCAGSARSARRWRRSWTRACRSEAAGSNGRSSPARRRSCFSTRPITPRSISRCARRAPTPASAPFAGLANAVLRDIARDRDRNPRRLRSARRRYAAPGSRRAGARPTARRPRGRSPPRTARSRRSTSASRATPRAGRERLGGIVLPTGSVRLDTHEAVADLEGYADGEWWVQDAAAALPARLFDVARRACASSISARRPGGKSAQLAAAGAAVTAVDRSAERLKRARRQFRAPAASFRNRRRRRARLRGAAVRRRAARRALHRHRHHSAPSRRRLDQASERPRRARASCRRSFSTRRSR